MTLDFLLLSRILKATKIWPVMTSAFASWQASIHLVAKNSVSLTYFSVNILNEVNQLFQNSDISSFICEDSKLLALLILSSIISWTLSPRVINTYIQIWIYAESTSTQLVQDFRGEKKGKSASDLEFLPLPTNKSQWRSPLTCSHSPHFFCWILFENVEIRCIISSFMASFCWGMERWSCTASQHSHTDGVVFYEGTIE